MSTLTDQELLAPSPIQPSGPPYNELWLAFENGPPPNTWSAVRLDRATGQLVMQLGTRQPSFTGQNGFYQVGLSRRIGRTRFAGTVQATLDVRPGPITRRFQGGLATVEAFLVLRNLVTFENRVLYQPLATNTFATISTRVSVDCNQAWEIQAGGVINFRGVQEAYAELIARLAARVTYPDGYQRCL